jgi:hypothetical protein
MKSNLTEKLLSICGDADKTYGCNDNEGITCLTERTTCSSRSRAYQSF